MSSAPTPAKTSAGWFRHFLSIRLALAALVCLPVGILLLRLKISDDRLRQAVEEADRLDPGWRVEELEAKRTFIPDDENGALQVPSVPKEGSPRRWYSGDSWPDAELAKALDELPPEKALNPMQRWALTMTLENAEPALVQARRLVTFRHGRYPIVYAPDGISTLLPYVQRNRTISLLLNLDSTLRADEGDADGALESCRAAVNAGRSIGDEPTLISQLVRLTVHSSACLAIERTLAQGQPSETALSALQRLLEDEEKQPLLLVGLRGERALTDRTIQQLQNLSGSPSQALKQLRYMEALSESAGGGPLPGAEEMSLLFPGSMKNERAAYLKYMNSVIEIAKKADHEQIAPFAEMEAAARSGNFVLRILTPRMVKITGSFHRGRALLRSAIVGVALERYRLANGRWPDTIAELTPKQLATVPIDPFDGKPLRFRRLADGVLIYSIGPDRQDNGGKLDRHSQSPAGTDVGFRLWDPGKRRQPPQRGP